MKHSLSRRHLLTRALQVASVGAVAPLRPRSDSEPLRTGAVAAGVVSLVWEPARRTWPARPAGTTSRVLFLSTDDRSASRPSDFDLEQGDVWWRHPGCSHRVEGVPVA